MAYGNLCADSRVVSMYLIAGLGNPGDEYARTRHNVGFMVLDRLAAGAGVGWRMESRFRARVARGTLSRQDALLCQPQTYMNLSGESVAAVSRYYRVPQENVLIVVDDADLALGRLRLRPGGSSGGHRGLASVEQHLGSRQYPRLRLGIGRRTEPGHEMVRYVLGRFSREERQVLDRTLERAAQAVLCWLEAGIEMAMNRFNGVDEPSETKEN